MKTNRRNNKKLDASSSTTPHTGNTVSAASTRNRLSVGDIQNKGTIKESNKNDQEMEGEEREKSEMTQETGDEHEKGKEQDRKRKQTNTEKEMYIALNQCEGDLKEKETPKTTKDLGTQTEEGVCDDYLKETLEHYKCLTTYPKEELFKDCRSNTEGEERPIGQLAKAFDKSKSTADIIIDMLKVSKLIHEKCTEKIKLLPPLLNNMKEIKRTLVKEIEKRINDIVKVETKWEREYKQQQEIIEEQKNKIKDMEKENERNSQKIQQLMKEKSELKDTNIYQSDEIVKDMPTSKPKTALSGVVLVLQQMGDIREAVESTQRAMLELTNRLGSPSDTPDTKIRKEILERDTKEGEDKITNKIEELAKTNIEANNEIKGEIKNLYKKLSAPRDPQAPRNKISLPRPLTTRYSLAVTSVNNDMTGDEVMNEMGKTGIATLEVNLSCRKAREGKVVVACEREEDKEQIRNELIQNKELVVEELKNKDPLIIIENALKITDINKTIEKIKNDKELTKNLTEEDIRIKFKFQKRGRNSLLKHLVLSVSPVLWARLTGMGRIKSDKGYCNVKDYSPLVQCSRCLGYGHNGSRCGSSTTKCAYCAQEHIMSACPARRDGVPPTCVNCQQAKKPSTDHAAFDEACPVREQMDRLARSRVAYWPTVEDVPLERETTGSAPVVASTKAQENPQRAAINTNKVINPLTEEESPSPCPETPRRLNLI